MQVSDMGNCKAQAPVIYSEEPLTSKHLNPHLLEVSILNQLHSFLRILQVHSLAHAGLGMGRGQANQSFQCPGSNWRCLRKEMRGLFIQNYTYSLGMPIIPIAWKKK